MRIGTMVIAGFALVLTACASEPERVLGKSWVGPRETPLGREYTPEAATRAGVAGWVVLGCRAGDDLMFTRCVLLGESPPGWRLGESALRMRGGLTGAHATQGTPRPGVWGFVPVFFCPDGDRQCNERLRPALLDFVDSARRVLSIAGRGDCPEALAAAAATGQAGLETQVQAQCRR